VDEGRSLRALFPGYYLPSSEARREAFTRGLVSFDANALLSLYRFTPTARQELLQVMRSLQSRIFITHQAAFEFHRGRLEVVDDRLTIASEESQELSKLLSQINDRIRAFSKRYQIGQDQRESLLAAVQQLDERLSEELMAATSYDLKREDVKNAVDPVIRELDTLLADRVGAALSDAAMATARKEAERRKVEKIPPGYSDAAKRSAYQAGDYIIWRQLLDQAKVHGRPVLFVSDDNKEDWMRIGRSKETLGPRPELVLEMQLEAGVQLHTASVLGLLVDAPKYLGSEVSSATLREAEALPRPSNVEQTFSDRAIENLREYEDAERDEFHDAAKNLQSWIEDGQPVGLHPQVDEPKDSKGLLVFRWSASGKALFRLKGLDGPDQVSIVWLYLNPRRPRSPDV
jgi:PIN like domain